jgi:type I restriction enzyme M protein
LVYHSSETRIFSDPRGPHCGRKDERATLRVKRSVSKRHKVGSSPQSLVARIEEVVLASSGADAFELVFALSAARLAGGVRHRGRGSAAATSRTRSAVLAEIDRAARRWPGLEPARELDVSDEALGEVLELLDHAGVVPGDLDRRGARACDEAGEALDAVFEQLVTRVGKGEKGQFFTPRHVVEMAARALLLEAGERVVDPACGSGAFLVHARAQADVEAWGFDVDARAVRVARLIAVATGADPARYVRADSLRRDEVVPSKVDVILTNPPFAGAVTYPGYALAAKGRRVERDALFVERCVEILRPGGRMAIVLPHSKVASRAWAGLRRWLVERARVMAVVSLPRETFLPHTAQKTAIVFVKKRVDGEAPSARERVFFAVSERAGKDAAGEPILRAGARAGTGDRAATWRTLDHDLDDVEAPLTDFLRAEAFAR